MTNSNLNARLKAVADAVDFTHRLLSAANTPNATLVSADARTLHGIQVYNAGTATYLKIYDKATAPDENDTPIMTIYLAATTSYNLAWDRGIKLANGLGYRMTTAAADNSTAAVAAAATLGLNILYRK